MRTLKSSDWGEGAATCVAGIAPLLQLIRCITRTRTSLIFANQVSSESAVRAGHVPLLAEWGLCVPPAPKSPSSCCSGPRAVEGLTGHE